MTRRLSSILLMAALLLLALMAAAPALGGDAADVPRQTWPSRTPTSSGPPPPNPPGTPPPEQTVAATPETGVLPLATQPPSSGAVESQTSGSSQSGGGATDQLVPGPLPIELPSAAEVGPCGLPPIAVALGPVNVRSGPGIEFETIAQLQFNDERVIVGRTAYSAWWQILLPPQQLGWVSDQAVSVVGFVGAVPIVAEGQAEEGTPPWNPTPNPVCTPPSQEEVSFSDGQLATVVLAERPTTTSNSTPTAEPSGGLDTGQTSPGFSLLRDNDASGLGSLIWLPIVGGFLIVAGGIALLLQRRQP